MSISFADALTHELSIDATHTCETNRPPRSAFSDGLDEEFYDFRSFLNARRKSAQAIVDGAESSDEDQSKVGSKTAETLGENLRRESEVQQDKQEQVGDTEERVALSKAESRQVLNSLNDFIRDLKQKTRLFQDLSTRRRAERAAESSAAPREVQEDCDCPICFETLMNPGSVLTPCGHMLHMQCVLQSLQNNDKCPICRTQIERGSLVLVRNGVARTVVANELGKKENTGQGGAPQQDGDGSKRHIKIEETGDGRNHKLTSKLDEELVANMKAIREAIKRSRGLKDLEESISRRERNVKEKLKQMKASTALLEKDMATSYYNLCQALDRRKREIEERRRAVALDQAKAREARAAAEKDVALMQEERTKLEEETVKTITAQERAAKEKENYLAKSKQLRSKEKTLRRNLTKINATNSVVEEDAHIDLHRREKVMKRSAEQKRTLTPRPHFSQFHVGAADYGSLTPKIHEEDPHDITVYEDPEDANTSIYQGQKRRKRQRLPADNDSTAEIHRDESDNAAVFNSPSTLSLFENSRSGRSTGRGMPNAPKRLRVDGNCRKGQLSLSDFAASGPKKIGNRPRSRFLFSSLR
eukprot:Plantae.Rhodophyta-Hildenbrandia_rubra.ctg11973.p1 GENE.Plantae.Rhodophyta-Hildenbrandia_rubra.ctg11973~~Plantae.Rhodophyta-Hildenbrandia_rubra.ctg11973.p1  ORF type:complete len:588 (-),score=106.75 Plantae.Rhodophyta-Hildenbrandia_rubra.ctg11973:2700-4463(-)